MEEDRWGAYFQQLDDLVVDIENRDSSDKEGLEVLRERTVLALQSLNSLLLLFHTSKPCFTELAKSFQTFLQILRREIVSFRPENYLEYPCKYCYGCLLPLGLVINMKNSLAFVKKTTDLLPQ